MFNRTRVGLAVLLSVAAGAGTTAATAAKAQAEVAPRTALCVTNCGSGVQGSGNLASHGGPVEGSSTNYLIFWGPLGETTATASLCQLTCPLTSGGLPLPSFDPDYASLIEGFFRDVGNTPYYGMLGQYGAGNSSDLGGLYVDPVPFAGATVNDSDVQAEVRKAEAANNWTGGVGHNFVVMLPPGQDECRGSECSGSVFCGYHDHESDRSGVQTPYIVIPFPEDPINPAACTAGESPNGDPAADDAVNVISHELFETVTDPLANAWFDAAGFEIGDKCAWTFGSTGLTGGDVTLHGNTFYVQREYSNRISDCALS
jgi:Phosphate-induced protein 1 conserved region